jgi:hypothetical protein
MSSTNAKVAKELLFLARHLAAAPADEGADEETPVEDEAFVAKLRDLRSALLKIGRKKNMRLSKFGIGMIRPPAKVVDLVDALLKFADAQ